jgi:multidrug efflux pump subunit AcrA (membrane-fusion protein)
MNNKFVQIGSVIIILVSAACIAGQLSSGKGQSVRPDDQGERGNRIHAAEATRTDPRTVHMTLAQQKAVGLLVESARVEMLPILVKAPGRVTPDEGRFAYITPRASGIVRSVSAQIGQTVRRGDVLAMVDSEAVGQARLQLITNMQTLEIANAQAEWQQVVFQNTLDLLSLLEGKKSPSEIHEQFQGRPVGDNRERLISAYANYRMAQASLARNKFLQASDAVSLAKYQEVLAEHEAAQATYEALMDEMKFEARLALTRSLQAKRQAETAVRITRERLRILGADLSDSKLETPPRAPAVEIQPGQLTRGSTKADSRGEDLLKVAPDQEKATLVDLVMPRGGQLASTYSLTAPFDGIVLDRELVVPGVAVDETHRIFTLADLSSVWVEVNVYESNFADLFSSRDVEVRIESPAYPGRTFQGQVLYTGDLVNEKSSSIRLLARADNPDRALKPGMFVEVVLVRTPKEACVSVPSSAILTEGDTSFVYIQTGPESFERREVRTRPTVAGSVAILEGVQPGEPVVIKECFKLKAEAARLAASDS